MVRLWLLATDFYHGFMDSIIGIKFISKILATERQALEYEPPEQAPKEMTVGRMRREQRGQKKFTAEELPRKDSFKKCLLKICLLNLGALFIWQFLVLFLHLIFSFFDKPHLGAIWGDLMIAPIFFISRIAQMLWCSDVSGAAMRALDQKPPLEPKPFHDGTAQTIISAIHSTVFLLQAILSQYLPIPIITKGIVFVHMALLNAMYSFDYFFEHFNLTFLRRMEIMEAHWPYFLGFGTPITLVCYIYPGMLLNMIIFAVFFPLTIISSYTANFNRRYDEKIPELQFCRISYMFTQVTARGIRFFFPHLFPRISMPPQQKQN